MASLAAQKGAGHIEVLVPRVLISLVNDALRADGDATATRSIQPVRGGFTSHALKLTTRHASYFLKWNESVERGRFRREARALALFRDTGTVAVPYVLAAYDATAERPGFLLQEWLTPPSRDQYLRRVGAGLGAKVAELHRAPIAGGYRLDVGDIAESLGGRDRWERDTRRRESDRGGRDARAPGVPTSLAIGAAGGGKDPSDGGEHDDWVSFLRERCFLPQIERAERHGRMTAERRRGLGRFLERLDDLLAGGAHRPSLLHGDLWRNNVLCNASGDLVLIDPNPWVGDREAELASTEYAGSFPPTFYDAYDATWPPAPGRRERRDAYVALAMLRELARGEPRGLAVDGLARWYAGPATA